eukprot:11529934-Karenia_brevis.AAC.1
MLGGDVTVADDDAVVQDPSASSSGVLDATIATKRASKRKGSHFFNADFEMKTMNHDDDGDDDDDDDA